MPSIILFVMRIDTIRMTPRLVVARSSILVRYRCLFGLFALSHRMLIPCTHSLRLGGMAKSRGAGGVFIRGSLHETFFPNKWWKPWPGVAVLHPMPPAFAVVFHRQYWAINFLFRLSEHWRCGTQQSRHSDGSDNYSLVHNDLAPALQTNILLSGGPAITRPNTHSRARPRTI